ncbi:MAG: hypothetical protein QM305_03270 [Bacteroidota bacterium]|nr:hypothetical protein [Bacteroidota bacterium]
MEENAPWVGHLVTNPARQTGRRRETEGEDKQGEVANKGKIESMEEATNKRMTGSIEERVNKGKTGNKEQMGTWGK